MRDDLLVEVVRGDIVESWHCGSMVLLDELGEVRLGFGDTAAPMFPRSSLKPAQATAMVRSGLELEPRLLALATASHSGGAGHVSGVEEILAKYGRTAADLQCPESLPLGGAERDAYVREGSLPDRLHFNCSGKHAGFIATSVVNDWPVASYLDPQHPMQQAALEVVEELTRERVTAVTVDGCGAPLFAISLLALARLFRSVATAPADSAEGRVAGAMRHYPEMVAGPGRDDTIAMQLMPGLISKIGAEGVIAFALPDGRAGAIKVSDGAARGHQPLLRAVLRAWGLADDAVAQLPVAPVLGGGRSMGQTRVSAQVAAALA
ncbi:MAG: asparaginase [Candidatus Nanopelagicales bacterium]